MSNQKANITTEKLFETIGFDLLASRITALEIAKQTEGETK